MTRQTETLKFLVDRGAQLDLQDERGYSGLHYAAGANYPDVCKVLLEGGVDVDLLNKSLDQSPLMIACIKGQTEAAKVLLDHGANSNQACPMLAKEVIKKL